MIFRITYKQIEHFLNECKHFAHYIQDFTSIITNTLILHVPYNLVYIHGL
jgi:hypothetical protein